MPTQIRTITNVDFGTLNGTKNKHLIKYNATSEKFEMISADNLLSNAATDNDLPDEFINVVELQVDPDSLTFEGADGGTF